MVVKTGGAGLGGDTGKVIQIRPMGELHGSAGARQTGTEAWGMEFVVASGGVSKMRTSASALLRARAGGRAGGCVCVCGKRGVSMQGGTGAAQACCIGARLWELRMHTVPKGSVR